MMIDNALRQDAKLWEDYLLSWTDSQQALLRLYHGLSDRVGFMRDQFEENAFHPILWDMMMILPPDDLLQLLDIVVAYAANPKWGFADRVLDVIHRMPEPLVVANIWEITEPYLDEDHPDADSRIWGLLQLYSAIDLELTARLAQWAVDSGNPDLVKSGDAWLARLKNDIPLI